MSRARSERLVIAYLAFTGILLAFGIDASLPAFDELRSAFGLPTDSNRISLIVTFYFVGMATGQLIYGPVSDRFGRVPAMLVGVGLYALGAVGAMLAPTFEALLGARLVWGLGAAACAALRTSIARDLYEGDQMARVIAVMMGVFMAGPILAPLIGEILLLVGGWQSIFGAAVVLAAIQAAWTLRFGETLDPAHRRPLRPTEVLGSFRVVFGTPVTARYTLALTASFGFFIIFLGSSQPVIDTIYGRGDQFALWFAVASVAMIVSFLSVNRFIERYGSARVAATGAAVATASGVLQTIVALATDGVPPFALWFALIVVANAFGSLLTPTCFSLALAPMGDRAGTASGVMGFVSSAGGAVLAGIISALIVNTVTPWGVGQTVYGAAAILLLWWARQGEATAPQPVPPADPEPSGDGSGAQTRAA